MSDQPLEAVLELPDPYGLGVLRGTPVWGTDTTGEGWELRTVWYLVRKDGTQQPLTAGDAMTRLVLALRSKDE